MLSLALGVSLAVAVSVAAAVYALNDGHGRPSVLAGVSAFPIVLVFATFVGAGPDNDAPAPQAACRVLSPGVTAPQACRPAGAHGEPSALEPAAIRFNDGSRLPLQSSRVTGEIESSTVTGKNVTISGWAAGVRDHQPATAILVYSQGRFVGAVRPIINRADVALAFRDVALTRSGYTFELPLGLVTARTRPSLQLFGVAGRASSRLAFDCVHKPKEFGC
jgi:hypothetical protein